MDVLQEQQYLQLTHRHFMLLLQVLAATQQGDSPASVRLAALAALRAHLASLRDTTSSAGKAKSSGEIDRH